MERTLRVKRLYSLGDYRNIEFEDVLYEIPEKLATNETVLEFMRTLQSINVELAFRKYIELVQIVPHDMANDKAQEALNQMRAEVSEKLIYALKEALNPELVLE